MAEVLAKQPRPRGPRLTIVTNAGGPGVLATDALIAGGGGADRDLAGRRWRRSTGFLPPVWSHNNPIDIIGDAPPGALREGPGDRRPRPGQRRAARDPHAPGDDRPDRGPPQALVPYARIEGKPVLACWMGGDGRRSRATQILREAGIPTFAYPDTAVEMFNYLWRSSQDLQAIYETPRLPVDDEHAVDRAAGGRRSSRRPGPRAGRSSPRTSRRRSWPPTASRSPRRVVAPTADEAVAAADADRLPGRAQALLPHDHPQDRRRRRAAQPERRGRRARRVRSRSETRSPRRRAPSTSRASPSSRWSTGPATS